MRPFLFLIVFGSVLSLTVRAQQSYTVEFNGKGEITAPLPTLLTTKDKLTFQVNLDQAASGKALGAVYLRYRETFTNLGKTDKNDNYTVLAGAGLENNLSAKDMLEEARRLMAVEMKNILENQNYQNILQSQYICDPVKDLEEINAFLKGLQIHNFLNIPTAKLLLDQGFLVENTFINGFDQAASNTFPCKPTVTLTAQTMNKCCTTVWASQPLTYWPYIGKGSFEHHFKLRTKNALFEGLKAQIDALSAKGKLYKKADMDKISDKVTKIIADQVKTYPAQKPLLDWLADRYEHDQSDDMKYRAAMAVRAQIPAFKKVLETESNKIIQNYNDNPDDLNWLFEFAWLTRGTALTANPLDVSDVANYAPQIAAATKTLKKHIALLNDVNQNILAVENTSKTNTAGANSANIVKQLQELQTNRVTLQANVDDAQEKLDNLTKQQTKSNQSAQDGKNLVLGNTLLYDGFFNINSWQNPLLSPNLPGYVYVQHHNAKNDMLNFDISRQKDINELQAMRVVVDNIDADAKLALVTQATLVTADLDPISQSLAKQAAPGAGDGIGLETANPLDSLYYEYRLLRNLILPYKHGIMSLPLVPANGQTTAANDKNVPHSDEWDAPTILKLTINDPTTGKNQNSEGVSFGYRSNKLYRFRFKAGIAYSGLERRSYTIDQASNTYSYTSTTVGLAPAIGIQIFLNRIDIQRPVLFPNSLYPYLYIGYMYNDAPLNNFLLGGGWEVFSGFAVAGGVHLGKTQALTVMNGILQTRDRYSAKPFISLNIGLEAFKAIFNTAKPATLPTNK